MSGYDIRDARDDKKIIYLLGQINHHLIVLAGGVGIGATTALVATAQHIQTSRQRAAANRARDPGTGRFIRRQAQVAPTDRQTRNIVQSSKGLKSGFMSMAKGGLKMMFLATAISALMGPLEPIIDIIGMFAEVLLVALYPALVPLLEVMMELVPVFQAMGQALAPILIQLGTGLGLLVRIVGIPIAHVLLGTAYAAESAYHALTPLWQVLNAVAEAAANATSKLEFVSEGWGKVAGAIESVFD